MNRLSTRLSAMIDDLNQFVEKHKLTLEEIERLEKKQRELDVKLAVATPKGYYDRVLSKLECTGGDLCLLMEALSDVRDAQGSSELVEHGMGEASTGRYLTLQERDLPLVVVNRQENDATAATPITLERWFNLGKKCPYENIADYVMKMEDDIARKAAQLDAVSPAKMICRVKCKLSWLGDITLLCNALHDRPVTEMTAESVARQVILVETKAVHPASCLANVDLVAITAKNTTKNKVHWTKSPPHIIGKKRRECSSKEQEFESSSPQVESTERSLLEMNSQIRAKPKSIMAIFEEKMSRVESEEGGRLFGARHRPHSRIFNV